MEGVDLNTFQFDYDQTWAVVFLRPDGTVLARYGTRASKDGMEYNSMEGLVTTMKQVLDANRTWSDEKQLLYAEKIGPKSLHRTADEIPSATITNVQNRKREGKEGCIHCHNVYDARRDFDISRNNYNPAQRYKYPLPINLGLDVEPTGGTRILNVAPGSPADQAGLRVGDEIERINGQPIHSLADIQFALHYLPEPAEARVMTRGNGAFPAKTFVVALPDGWRKGDISWRVSMYGMPPKPGLWIEALPDDKKLRAGIAKDKLALKVRGVFGADVRKGGLKKDDIIVQFADQSDHYSEGDFHAYLRLNHYQPKSQLPLKILRDGKKRDLVITFENSQ